jgi:hypothetical protein
MSNRGIYEVWEQMFVTRKWQCVLFHKLLIWFTVWVIHLIWDKLSQSGSILTTGRRRVYCACAMRPYCQLFFSLSYGFWSRSLKTRAEHYKVSLDVKSNAPLKCWYISFQFLKGNAGLHQSKTLCLKNMYLFPWYRMDLEESFSISSRRKRFLSSPNRPDGFWNPHRLP